MARQITTQYACAALLLMSITSGACAQSTNIDALVAQALADNPEVAAAKAMWDAARARVPQMRALMDPMIGADVERMGSTKLGDYSDVEYMVQQDVPWFGKRRLAGSVEEGMARQAEMQYRMKALDVAAMVKRMAYDLWQTEGEVRVNQANQDLMKQFVEIATTHYNVGKGSQADIFKAKTELDKLSQNEADIDRMRDSARADLNRFLGHDADKPVDIGAFNLVPSFALDLDGLKKRAQEANLELRGMKEGMIASSRSRLDLANKVYQPDLQFRVEARQFEGSSNIEEYDTALFLNIPWFNRRKNNAAIAEAKSMLVGAEQNYEAMRLKIDAEVDKLVHGISTMQHHYDLYISKILPQQGNAVTSSRAGYESGDMDFLDLLDAQRMLLMFEMENLHNAAEAFRLAAELEALTGGAQENRP